MRRRHYGRASGSGRRGAGGTPCDARSSPPGHLE
jgi:hypothetical protein